MSGFGEELARMMTARGVGVRELARMIYCNPGHISNLRSGKANPSPELAQSIDNALGADGALAALAPRPSPHARQSSATWDQTTTDGIAAIELGRRAEASDLGSETVERLTLAVDDLAIAYPSTPPGELLGAVRAHLGYVGQLLDARTTLVQHRGLLVAGGWLSRKAAHGLGSAQRPRRALR